MENCGQLLVIDHSPKRLSDPISGEKQPLFDLCWDNWIGKEVRLKIIDAIQSNEATNAQEKHFYASFLQWIEKPTG